MRTRTEPKNSLSSFTLLELLVVISVVGILAAIVLPVIAAARGKARESACVSNERQIGLSIASYMQDYDGLFPNMLDPTDRLNPWIWSENPEFMFQIPNIPFLQDALKPYANATEVFHCPADTGFDVDELSGNPLDPLGKPPNARPSSYAKFGTSYYYRTELAAKHISESTVHSPSNLLILVDGSATWHGYSQGPFKSLRSNVLFADGRVKSLSFDQELDAWHAEP